MVLISGQFVSISGQPIIISLSGTPTAIDTINFALIQQDVIHRKVHQGLQWNIYHTISGTPTNSAIYEITTSGAINPIHMAWDVRAVPGTLVRFIQVNSQPFVTSGVPLQSPQNFNLSLSGITFTKVAAYGSVFNAGGGIILYEERITSGTSVVGFGTLDSYPIRPNEWVLTPKPTYQFQIYNTGRGAVNFHASWYESGA